MPVVQVANESTESTTPSPSLEPEGTIDFFRNAKMNVPFVLHNSDDKTVYCKKVPNGGAVTASGLTVSLGEQQIVKYVQI